MNENLSRRERKKQETRQRLIEVALRLFRERGYDATTIGEITEGADVAKGTFFNYFETKEAILPALAEWRLRQLEQALEPERGAPASPVARIKLTLSLVAEELLDDRLPARRLFAAVAHHRDARPGRALLHLLAGQVQQAQAAGEIRADLDPLVVAGIIHALLFQQMMMWYHGHRPAPLPQMLEATVDMLLDGIGGPGWRQAA